MGQKNTYTRVAGTLQILNQYLLDSELTSQDSPVIALPCW